MERTVFSMFVTTPRVNPSDVLFTDAENFQFAWIIIIRDATIAHTFVVPISKPTAISCSILLPYSQ